MGLQPGIWIGLGEPVTAWPLSHSLTPAGTRTSPEPQALVEGPDTLPFILLLHLVALYPSSPKGLLSTLMDSPRAQVAATILIKAIPTGCVQPLGQAFHNVFIFLIPEGYIWLTREVKGLSEITQLLSGRSGVQTCAPSTLPYCSPLQCATHLPSRQALED